MRLAIVHDYLNQFGGAERVIQALHELYPDAPIYTSIYDAERMPDDFKKMDIRTSFMQKLPFVFNLYRYYFLLYPFAFESFDLSEYDVILSSSSHWAKGIKKQPDQLHICYCHNPMRFVWRFDDYFASEPLFEPLKRLLPFFLEPIKKWDLATNRGVDYFIANSQTVKKRISQIYERIADVINPPVETSLFKPSTISGDYFLVVSRLSAYKRVDLVVQAFNQLDLDLKIIGQGPDLKRLQSMAGSNVDFLGRLSDNELANYIANCRALILPGEEDFGIVPVEAMAAGRPVIAFNRGGATETVIDGQVGVLFDEQSVEELLAAIKRFQFETFDPQKIRQHALEFDKSKFKERIKRFVDEKYLEKTTII